MKFVAKRVVALLLMFCVTGAAPQTAVRFDDSEARAVLVILQELQSGKQPGESEWATLFATEGYRRLKQREAEFKRPFSDDDFRKFVTSPQLVAKTNDLQRTLGAWSGEDLTQMESRARAYLPAGAALRATIYPLIKPKTNSFVYQLDTNPAVMLYVDPTITGDQFSNTVSHELLHVGDAENCPPRNAAAQEKSYSTAQKAYLDWLSAFGEGWAVLAAAGGPGRNPHWEDSARERAVWDAQMATYDTDFQNLAAFFTQIADGTLTGNAIANTGFTFFGVDQGPWYTVGYKMDTTIEREFGRSRLIASLCDKRDYFATYNRAAQQENGKGAHLPLWPDNLVTFVQQPRP